jgi:hypothetical protein
MYIWFAEILLDRYIFSGQYRSIELWNKHFLVVNTGQLRFELKYILTKWSIQVNSDLN